MCDRYLLHYSRAPEKCREMWRRSITKGHLGDSLRAIRINVLCGVLPTDQIAILHGDRVGFTGNH